MNFYFVFFLLFFSTSLRSHERWKVVVSLYSFFFHFDWLMFQFLVCLCWKTSSNVRSTSVVMIQKFDIAWQTFRPDLSIYFRHAFLIFDLNEKKQRTESSRRNIQFLYGKNLRGIFSSSSPSSMIFKISSSLSFLFCGDIYVKKHE